ncbi:N-acyl-D-glucosamine 2-epimerase [Paenibacillus melissococcoides]|uniref:N-acyl-D-glucosamine 2-epimerase n=1 Tax=Paenibacillus melissococcoides TaxID=2912268 RepID=A0ABM9FZ25_9BACL|nr:N-acyl-D-glucosamine 2-epimerase [Paenibacillus melissococcoides]CAH8244494.1 N-acyl-D-glucosamine 2-epimerase [Paenibacillus melissococcoides]CAH8708148.1 N-acyl-D-glucosamine 2-epimerase [Paenibacillus melissococcoides]CAH8708854.1 N-acyl-D-glucosamine 2-epimerase [Paenibacillus melissococcoides]
MFIFRQRRWSRQAGICLASLTVLFGVLPVGAQAAEQGEQEAGSTLRLLRQASALSGSTIQVDPVFPYYQNRSAASIADEIVQNGYKSVRYFVVNENHVNRGLVEAFQERGLFVWALVLGNGSYSVEGFPADWPSWQMELLTPVNDGYYRFSPHSEAYVNWKKEKLASLVRSIPFDGIEVAEPYFPEWDGIDRGVYGDVGPLAQAAFREQYGHDRIPNFTDPDDPDFYLMNVELYEDWIEFRVEAVNRFLNELMNGKGGVRDAKKDILAATWSLAIDAGPDSVDTLREMQGLDAAAMISAVRPDLHILQTHWPDWMKPQDVLPPQYIRSYQSFVDQIRSVHPNIPLGVQADIGSSLDMVKDRAWYDSFGREAAQMGFRTWTAYEYHLGKYMYEEPPVPVTVARTRFDKAVITFQKRIDEPSAKLPGSLHMITEEGETPVPPEHIAVDGNMLIIEWDRLPKKEFRLRIQQVTDTPSYWLYNKDQPANAIKVDTIVTAGKKNH